MITIPERELAQLRCRVHLLKDMATHINAGLDMDQILERTILEAHKSLPQLRISFATLDSSGLLRIVRSVSPLHMPAVEGRYFPVQETAVLDQVLPPGQTMAVSDIADDPRLPELMAFLQRFHTRSLLATRVQHPLHLFSVLAFAHSEAHAWSEHERAMIGDMAEYLAIALRQAQLRSEQERIDAQLRDTQRMETVGRLVGGVAHDFNNLLTGMMIYTGLLASALGPGNPLQRHVRELQAAGERGASLIGQLLSMSRQHVLELRTASLNDVVSGLREMLQRMVGEDVLIECHLAGDLPEVRIDENQLQQAILNLAVNARDAMRQGGRLVLSTVAIHADAALAAKIPGMTVGDYSLLRVEDTGAGMPPETLARCFEPFFTTKPRGEGTGLGLAAVFGTVQQHGGCIAVRSVVGQGTAFDLYFPAAATGESAPSAGSSVAGLQPTVLLVEDEAMLRLPLSEQLQGEGYRVLTAATGEGALEIAQRFPGEVDLLVTDLVMPGLCGHEVADRLSLTRPSMKVLFMSGYTDDLRARRLVAHGANFLRKPFRPEDFLRTVRRLTGPETGTGRAGEGISQKSASILGKGN